MLDRRLRMHVRLRVGGELLHGRRAAEAVGRRAQLLEDLLVGVALAQPRLEVGERRRIDLRDGAVTRF